MRVFQSRFLFWPRPRLLGNSKDALGASLEHRVALAEQSSNLRRPETVRQIVEAHHDRHAQTFGPSR